MPPIPQYFKTLCHITWKQHVAPGRVPCADVPITKNYIFIHSNTSHLIQSWVNLILHLTWSQKGNTQVIKSRLQQASHPIIPSTWASTCQAAQDTWTPQQLVLAEAVVREWDHDMRGLCPWDQGHPIHSYKILIIWPKFNCLLFRSSHQMMMNFTTDDGSCSSWC